MLCHTNYKNKVKHGRKYCQSGIWYSILVCWYDTLGPWARDYSRAVREGLSKAAISQRNKVEVDNIEKKKKRQRFLKCSSSLGNVGSIWGWNGVTDDDLLITYSHVF